MSHHDNSPNDFKKGQGKSNSHLAQKKAFFLYLQKNIATASMATEDLGIPQKCLTRYKRDLEKVGSLKEVKKDYCKHTGFRAYYLTTNPEWFPDGGKQLNLF